MAAAVKTLAMAQFVAPPLSSPTWWDRLTFADLKQVRHVSFHGIRPLDDAQMSALRYCPRLERLSLHGTSVTDEGLRHLERLRHLRVLSLKSTQVTDAGLAHLSGLKSLEWLQLSGPGVQGTGLEHLQDLHRLQLVELQDVPVDDRQLENLRKATDMRNLWLHRCKITGAGLGILRDFPRLESLRIHSDQLQDVRIARIPNLESLFLRGSFPKSGELVVEDLPRCTNLVLHAYAEEGSLGVTIRNLPMLRALNVLSGTVVHLKQLPQLEQLTLDLSRCEEFSLEAIPQLRHLAVAGGRAVSEECLASIGTVESLISLSLSEKFLQDSWLRHFGHLHQLERLFLRGTTIDGSGLGHLRELRNLRVLELGPGVTTDGLTGLSNFPQLERLTIYGPSISDAALAHVQDLRQLQHLELLRSDIQGHGLEYLQGLTELRYLAVPRSHICDEHLTHLEKLQQLEFLSIGGTQVSDWGVPALARLRGLREIYVGDTRITSHGFQRLHEALPQARIVAGASREYSAIIYGPSRF